MFEQRMSVTAEAEVIWGPDPADVTALADHAAISEDKARAALVWMHERQEQQT